MAARSRPRGSKDETDAHEERDLWTKIAKDIHGLDSSTRRAPDVASEIAALEEKLRDIEPTMQDMEELEKLYKEQLDIANQETASLHKVMEWADLLIALRTASAEGERSQHSKRGEHKRSRPPLEAASADSPSARNMKMQRSNSAAPVSAENLQRNAEVAYRLPKQKNAEGEWIQCIVTNIYGEGNKRKYEVCDPEPDEHGLTPKYKAFASALIPIPKENTGLQPYPVGKQVLARYPETTTFYRAEVMGTKRDGTCRLKFEGEEEVGKEQEVERRLVLDIGGK